MNEKDAGVASGAEEVVDGLGERYPGSEAVDPDSAAGAALDPARAVNAEVAQREGAYGDNPTGDDEPIP